MIFMRNRVKAFVGISAAVMALVGLNAAPAQAASCNSGRVCFYKTDGTISNVNVLGIPRCGPTTYHSTKGTNYMHNRANYNWVHVFYDYNGDGQVPPWDDQVASLASGEGATLNPASRYYYCVEVQIILPYAEDMSRGAPASPGQPAAQ